VVRAGKRNTPPSPTRPIAVQSSAANPEGALHDLFLSLLYIFVLDKRTHLLVEVARARK
jgi:hypothetical protein